MSRPRGIPSHIRKSVRPGAHPLVRHLTDLQVGRGLTDREMCRLAGYHEDLPTFWRRNLRWPNLRALADFAEVFGYEVRLVPIDRAGGNGA